MHFERHEKASQLQDQHYSYSLPFECESSYHVYRSSYLWILIKSRDRQNVVHVGKCARSSSLPSMAHSKRELKLARICALPSFPFLPSSASLSVSHKSVNSIQQDSRIKVAVVALCLGLSAVSAFNPLF